MIVLRDMREKDFTEGDYVIISTTNGLRCGTVLGIKEVKTRWDPVYRIKIEFDSDMTTSYARAHSYEYFPQNICALDKNLSIL